MPLVQDERAGLRVRSIDKLLYEDGRCMVHHLFSSCLEQQWPMLMLFCGRTIECNSEDLSEEHMPAGGAMRGWE